MEKQKALPRIFLFLVALVNVYVVFWLLQPYYGAFIALYYQFLTLISENIKDVQLGKANKKLNWKNEEEIGLLGNNTIRCWTS